MFRFFSKLLGNCKTTTKNLTKKCSPQHNSGLCWNRPWPQNCSPNIVFVRHRIYKMCEKIFPSLLQPAIRKDGIMDGEKGYS
jgi:hypothetical protein